VASRLLAKLDIAKIKAIAARFLFIRATPVSAA
jgi:hypothetical protein